MAMDGPKPGFFGNLNQDQEAKLQKSWSLFLTAMDSPTNDDASDSQPPRRQSSTLSKSSPQYQQKVMAALRELGIKGNETKMVENALSKITPAELRQGMLDLLKHDHPDTMLLRFLRARKWDLPRAFAMAMEAMVWRVKEGHVDDDVLPNGELHAVMQERGSNAVEKKAGKDFLAQMRMGKAWVHGTDKLGRPIVTIRVKLHKPGAQTEEALERFIVHVIESVRLTVTPPVETACVLFDMTDFSLSNVEYPPIKFILKCFEANYPESLGVLLIHNAPWVFSGVWRLIRGWMDPDIAAKVQFTNSVADLNKFIAPEQLLKNIGGQEEWTYEYIEPNENENDMMKDTTTRDALQKERRQIGEEFLTATSEWIEAAKSKDQSKIQAAESQRAYQAERLRVNYWKLDPYVRARMCLDREGVIQAGGKIVYYPKDVPSEKTIQETGKMLELTHLENVNGNAQATA